MFDIGFSELLLFGVIALVVLGPEKLPHAARTAGQWYAKLRRAVSTLQNEIEAELDLAETRQKMQEELAKIKQAEAEMKREMAELRGSMKEFETAQNESLQNASIKTSAIDLHKPEPNLIKDAEGKTANNEIPDNSAILDKTESDFKGKSNRTSSLAGSEELAELTTRPWRHMWFLLGAYDKARRLPPPPFKPNYHVDTLLNAPSDRLTSDTSNLAKHEPAPQHNEVQPNEVQNNKNVDQRDSVEATSTGISSGEGL